MSINALRAAATGDLKEKSKLPAKQAGGGTVAAFFDKNKATLQAVLPKHVSPDRMLKIALGALRTTPKLMDCTVESLFGAVVQCAQLGLEPNTPMGHVYLIPFDKKKQQGGQWIVERTDVQIVIGYKGMLDLARRSGQIVSIAAHEVCERDEFDYAYGLDERLEHKPAMGDRGDIIAFYAVAKLKDGGHCFEVMSRAQVEGIRDNSQGYKAAEANAKRYKKPGDSPWHNQFAEMGRKTVTRRLFKWLPMSIEMATASALEGRSEAGQPQSLDTVLSGEFSVIDPDAPMLESDGGEVIDDHTGEVVTESHSDGGQGEEAAPTAPTMSEVQKALESAKTLDDLNTAADWIRDVKNPAHQNLLNGIYDQRSTELQ